MSSKRADMRRALSALVAFIASVPTLAQTLPCPAWSADSDQIAARFGNAVAGAGDVDGDGFDDVLVGAEWFDDPVHPVFNVGAAFLFRGSPAGLEFAPAWRALGPSTFAQLGYSVASAGDVNGDGYDDVLVGLPTLDDSEPDEGAVYLYQGSPAGLPLQPSWSLESDTDDTLLGYALAGAGDVNGDGYDDVLVGAAVYDGGQTNEGRALLYLGSAAGLGAAPAWSFEGDQERAWLGNALALGDVNGDGFADALVAAYQYANGEATEGRVYAFLGSAAGLATSPSWTVESDVVHARFGGSLATGDVNGDGFDDVIVGAADLGPGSAFAYMGSASGPSTSPAWSVQGHVAFEHFGISVGTGDWNHDGFDDVIVGAPHYSKDATAEGRALVYPGSAAGLASLPAWSARTGVALAYFGSSVAGAGDVNGDGFDDAVIGAEYLENDHTDEGMAFAYEGSPLGLSRSAVFAGSGVNADKIQPVDVLVGGSWSAPLTLGHAHGSAGALTLRVHGAAVQGPSFPSPVGGRTTQLLVAGPLLASLGGTHDALTGDIPPQPIPNQLALVGMPWAAQYIVTGGGFADLSQAVVGLVHACR